MSIRYILTKGLLVFNHVKSVYNIDLRIDSDLIVKLQQPIKKDRNYIKEQSKKSKDRVDNWPDWKKESINNSVLNTTSLREMNYKCNTCEGRFIEPLFHCPYCASDNVEADTYTCKT